MVNINVRFPNLAQTPRREVLYTALPFAPGEWNGESSLVVRDLHNNEVDSYIEPIGARWPDGSVRYAKMLSNISLNANEVKNVRVTDGISSINGEFIFHEAVSRANGFTDIRLILKEDSGVSTSISLLENMYTIESNRLRKVFLTRHRIGNFVIDFKMYIMSKQQIIKYELSVTGSDPRNTLLVYPLTEIVIAVTGDDNTLLNVRGQAKRGVSPLAQHRTYRLTGPTTFGDGQKQSWHGEIYVKLDIENGEQVANALSAFHYTAYGMSTDWGIKNAYSSLNAIQKPDTQNVNSYWTQIVNQFHEYFNFINSPGNLWDDYTLGLTKTPSQTGDQGDFGCLDAGAVLYMGAAELLDFLYFMATEETKRPGHYYEIDTREVTSANHPNWVTWNGVTHWHNLVSSDKLGKTQPDFAGSTARHGWDGKDWEHHSSNILSLAALMTGSYLLLDEVNHEVENYLAGHTLPSMKPGWSTNDRYPPRAFGRTHHAMCNHYLLTNRQDLLTRMIARFNECVLPNWDGATHSPVKNWQHIRDDRVLGVQVDAWVPWNDSLGFVGIVALYNVTRNQAIKNLMISWGNTILDYGWKSTMVGNQVTSLSLGGGVKWNDNGQPLTAEEYNDPAKYIPAGAGVVMWGVQVLEVIRNNPSVFGQEKANKAALYAQYMREQYLPNPQVPFSEYGQWLAIKLMP